MGSRKVRLSVIIPTFNEEFEPQKYLRNCLKSLARQTLPRHEYEIIVVDGNSLDKTVDVAKKWADKVIFHHSGDGVGSARNDGVFAARGDIIVTTDADTLVPPWWLERIALHFQRDGTVGVVGSAIPLEPILKAKIFFFFLQFLQKISCLLGLPGMPGFNTAVKKDVLLKIGGWADLPYCDDMELAFRLRKEGKIIFDPALVVENSARRMEIEGYWHIATLWGGGALRLMLKKRLKPFRYFRKYKSWAYPEGVIKPIN